MTKKFDELFQNNKNAFSLPADFSQQMAKKAANDFRFRRRIRIATQASCVLLFCGLIVWGMFGLNHNNNKTNSQQIEVASVPSQAQKNSANTTNQIVSLNPISKSNDALKSLAKAAAQSRWPESVSMKTTQDDATQEPTNTAKTIETFATTVKSAKSNLEPVSNPVSRATSRFVKDFGSAFNLNRPQM